jgi:GDP-4-dehydro-6-deoxy-D-mannose reductase
MTKLLVTGASGFIGRNLIARLHNYRHNIIEASRICGDVSDKSTWSQFSHAEVVIHLAANTFVPDSWKDPNAFLKTNLQGTACALDYCRQHDAKFVFLSTYLYGNPSSLPIPESAPLVASNPYALSKKLAEEVCEFYANTFGVRITILRPFNVYGPNQSSQFLIPSLIDQVLTNSNICVKDLEPRRDYIYIDDLVDAIIKASDNRSVFDIFNIGTGVSHSVAELIDIIQNIRGTVLDVHSAGERRQDEVMDTQADVTRARQILGWTPRYSLRAGLERILNPVE